MGISLGGPTDGEILGEFLVRFETCSANDSTECRINEKERNSDDRQKGLAEAFPETTSLQKIDAPSPKHLSLPYVGRMLLLYFN